MPVIPETGMLRALPNPPNCARERPKQNHARR
jgi:hypothetical protein